MDIGIGGIKTEGWKWTEISRCEFGIDNPPCLHERRIRFPAYILPERYSRFAASAW